MQKDFSYPLKVSELSQNAQTYKIKADKEQLQTLKNILKLKDVKTFEASITLKLNHKKNRLDVDGCVDSLVTLQSVISLELFDKSYHLPFEFYYDTSLTYQDLKEMDLGINDDVPDIIENDMIDLGQIAIERLALALDDYPRMEGEEFCFVSEFDEKTTKDSHPFAALKKLKR